MVIRGKQFWAVGMGAVLTAMASAAIAQNAPENILPPAPTAKPAPTASTSAAVTPPAVPIIQPIVPLGEPVMSWKTAHATALLGVIEGIAAEGLISADYQPDALRAAIAAGEGIALDTQASRSFSWLVEDMRDGRTRMDSRIQWFAVDPDVDLMPTTAMMAKALDSGDVAGVIASLAPTHPDYVALKAALAATPKADRTARNLIQVNMDRWRWLARDMGKFYLLTNVPEFQLRLTVDNSIIRSYRTIVGKPGRTATPQLAEVVEGVIFNPTWTVPQSIVRGEGLGAQLLANPARARSQNYKVTKGANGYISVVQGSGPGNALGKMKLDMPNEHAIFLHDTPNRGLFASSQRALSHGCVRTERATELAMTMAILGAGLAPEQGVAIVNSGKYTRVPMTRTFPVYITYFTMASDIGGQMKRFNDLYGRDGAVIASFAAPRKPWDGKRKSSEAIIQLDNPL